MKKLFVLGLPVFLAGCIATPTVIEISSEFDSMAAQSQIEPGKGYISGTAFMRQRGGGVVTCAGNNVTLVPSTAYARERLAHIYQSTPTSDKTSVRDVRESIINPQQFMPSPIAYKNLVKETICDAQGNFEFTDIKDGDYFIVTSVYWETPSPQGGVLAKSVNVKSGKAPRVILSH